MPEIQMQDPMAKWTPVPDWSAATISRDHWQARPVLGLDIVMLAEIWARPWRPTRW